MLYYNYRLTRLILETVKFKNHIWTEQFTLWSTTVKIILETFKAFKVRTCGCHNNRP